MSNDLNFPRLQPHDVDAERAILGALLLDPSRLSDAQDVVSESDFYRSSHRSIFSAMCRLADHNEPIDQVTLTDQLKRDGRLETIGGAAYLAELWAWVPSSANLSTHAQIVRDHAMRRQLTIVAQDILEQGYASRAPIADVIDTAEQAIYALGHQPNRGGFHSIGDLAEQRLDHLNALYERKADITGLPTGFGSIDRLTAGLQAEDLIIVGARPSMGKTALSLAFARHVALKLDRPVALFSLEMSKEQITDRILSAESYTDAHIIRTGQLDANAWKRVGEATQRVRNAPLFIDDSPALTVSQLRSKVRRLKSQRSLDLCIVDYLQLMQLPRGAESRQQGMADISRDLKLLARELQIPVIALAQLNRNVEGRSLDERRPGLADLRDSGAIEQDADVVMFIYRDEVYNVDSPDRGIAEILIRKHRNGPIGDVRLVFIDRFASFEDLRDS